MDAVARIADLAIMHPRLLWDDIGAAAAAVLAELTTPAPYLLVMVVRDVSNFADRTLRLTIDTDGVSAEQVARVRRTYEPSRLVELAAIAIAGLALYHAGRHEIRDVALRGSAADYLVDDANHLLEIAGRSRRSDWGVAWEQRWERLSRDSGIGFYVCVVEFESPAGQLAFRA
jgi:hypothetical protein